MTLFDPCNQPHPSDQGSVVGTSLTFDYFAFLPS